MFQGFSNRIRIMKSNCRFNAAAIGKEVTPNFKVVIVGHHVRRLRQRPNNSPHSHGYFSHS